MSLASYSPWNDKESDISEYTQTCELNVPVTMPCSKEEFNKNHLFNFPAAFILYQRRLLLEGYSAIIHLYQLSLLPSSRLQAKKVRFIEMNNFKLSYPLSSLLFLPLPSNIPSRLTTRVYGSLLNS